MDFVLALKIDPLKNNYIIIHMYMHNARFSRYVRLSIHKCMYAYLYCSDKEEQPWPISRAKLNNQSINQSLLSCQIVWLTLSLLIALAIN